MTHDWRVQAQVPDAYRVASLDLVTQKIAGIHAVSDTRVTPHLIAHLAAEAAYWLSAVEESIYDLPGYQADREADDVGRALPGIRYARNAATHALVKVAGGDVQPFLGRPADGYFLFISSTPRWIREPPPPPSPKPSRRDATNRTAFVEHLAGRSVTDTLEGAQQWLRSAISR